MSPSPTTGVGGNHPERFLARLRGPDLVALQHNGDTTAIFVFRVAVCSLEVFRIVSAAAGPASVAGALAVATELELDIGAVIRMVGALMLEQNDEWVMCHRYMPVAKTRRSVP